MPTRGNKGANDGKIQPKSTSREPTISMSVRVDPRHLAEVVMMLEKNGITGQTKSSLGRICIEIVADKAVEQGLVPRCETISKAFNLLKRRGITWNRDQDVSRVSNLLTFESAHLESYGDGFDPGTYKQHTPMTLDEGIQAYADSAGISYEEAKRIVEEGNSDTDPEDNDYSPDSDPSEQDDYFSSPGQEEDELDQKVRDKDKDFLEQMKRQMSSGEDD